MIDVICKPLPISDEFGNTTPFLTTFQPHDDEIHRKPELSIAEEREILSKAILKAHKFSRSSCYDCSNLVQGDGFKRCIGGQYDCCQCAACKIARRILNESPATPLNNAHQDCGTIASGAALTGT